MATKTVKQPVRPVAVLARQHKPFYGTPEHPLPVHVSKAGNPKPRTLAEATARRLHYQQVTKDLDWEDRPSGAYSTNEMWVVFGKVQNPKGWKFGQRGYFDLTDEEINILQRAVPEFTGGPVSITPTEIKGNYYVQFEGYYIHIGA